MFCYQGSEYRQMWDDKVVGHEFGSVSQNQETMVAGLKVKIVFFCEKEKDLKILWLLYINKSNK